MLIDDIVEYLRNGGDPKLTGIYEGTEEADIVRYMLTHPEHSSYTARQKLLVKKYGPVPDGFETWGEYWKSL